MRKKRAERGKHEDAAGMDTAPNAGTKGATAKPAPSPRRTTPKKGAAKEKRAKSRRHSGSERTAGG